MRKWSARAVDKLAVKAVSNRQERARGIFSENGALELVAVLYGRYLGLRSALIDLKAPNPAARIKQILRGWGFRRKADLIKQLRERQERAWKDIG